MIQKIPKEFYQPGQSNPEVADRKSQFDDINRYVTARHGWVTSVRGDIEVRFECVADSPLADELREGAGFKFGGRMVRLPLYDVREDGEGQRILAHAVRQEFVQRADGQLEALTEGSRPVSTVVTGAGIRKVNRYAFDLP